MKSFKFLSDNEFDVTYFNINELLDSIITQFGTRTPSDLGVYGIGRIEQGTVNITSVTESRFNPNYNYSLGEVGVNIRLNNGQQIAFTLLIRYDTNICEYVGNYFLDIHDLPRLVHI